jgi:8-oxo-dGTP diphosphatase
MQCAGKHRNPQPRLDEPPYCAILAHRMAKNVIRVVAAVIEHDGRYLITQRTPTAVLPLLWEFPGGRVEDGENETQALVREVVGRIGCEVAVFEKLGDHFHEYDKYDVLMSMFACALPAGAEPRPVGVNAVRWVTSEELGTYEFPAADQSSMSKLLGLSN